MMPALPLAGLLFVLAVAAFLIWLFVSAAFLLWGARLAGIAQRSFGRAVGTVLLGSLATAIVAVLFNTAPLVGTASGLLLGFCVMAGVMMALFDTTFGRALAATILAWLLSLLTAAGFVLLGFFLLGVLAVLA